MPRALARQVVERLGRPETRDELGLGAIRDAFANALFPGMNTVQRPARCTMLAALVERRTAWTEVRFPWDLDVPELTRSAANAALAGGRSAHLSRVLAAEVVDN